MNTQILLLVNGWAGKNFLLDNAMIFSARYLIYIVFIIAGGCVAYLIYTHQRRSVLYVGATLLLDFIFLKAAATVYAQFFVDHRPFIDHHLTQLIPHAAGHSFPSDHVTATIAIAMGLLLFTPFRKWGAFVLVAALLIGFARVFCGVHYPIDIAGAILTGILGAGVIYAISRFIIIPPAADSYQSHPAE
ncbi:MAG: phosphatase PAP2 family protein [Abditibacteriaceae bacterium]